MPPNPKRMFCKPIAPDGAGVGSPGSCANVKKTDGNPDQSAPRIGQRQGASRPFWSFSYMAMHFRVHGPSRSRPWLRGSPEKPNFSGLPDTCAAARNSPPAPRPTVHMAAGEPGPRDPLGAKASSKTPAPAAAGRTARPCHRGRTARMEPRLLARHAPEPPSSAGRRHRGLPVAAPALLPRHGRAPAVTPGRGREIRPLPVRPPRKPPGSRKKRAASRPPPCAPVSRLTARPVPDGFRPAWAPA